MQPERRTLRRVRWLTGFFMLGLIASGLTAIPLEAELDWAVKLLAGEQRPTEPPASDVIRWLLQVQSAVAETNAKFPFLAYGMDWLAFGHVAIAIAFVGALRDPMRNRWLFDFGLIACALVVPYAMIAGACRGIPLFWRVVDCAFGVCGAVPLWLCRRWLKERAQGGRELPQPGAH